MAGKESSPNPLFKLVVVVSGIFFVTILSMIVTALAPGESPLVKFFDDYGLTLIGIEVGLLLLLIFTAMALDRRQTLAERASGSEGKAGDSATGSVSEASSDEASEYGG